MCLIAVCRCDDPTLIDARALARVASSSLTRCAKVFPASFQLWPASDYLRNEVFGLRAGLLRLEHQEK